MTPVGLVPRILRGLTRPPGRALATRRGWRVAAFVGLAAALGAQGNDLGQGAEDRLADLRQRQMLQIRKVQQGFRPRFPPQGGTWMRGPPRRPGVDPAVFQLRRLLHHLETRGNDAESLPYATRAAGFMANVRRDLLEGLADHPEPSPMLGALARTLQFLEDRGAATYVLGGGHDPPRAPTWLGFMALDVYLDWQARLFLAARQGENFGPHAFPIPSEVVARRFLDAVQLMDPEEDLPVVLECLAFLERTGYYQVAAGEVLAAPSAPHFLDWFLGEGPADRAAIVREVVPRIQAFQRLAMERHRDPFDLPETLEAAQDHLFEKGLELISGEHASLLDHFLIATSPAIDPSRAGLRDPDEPWIADGRGQGSQAPAPPPPQTPAPVPPQASAVAATPPGTEDAPGEPPPTSWTTPAPTPAPTPARLLPDGGGESSPSSGAQGVEPAVPAASRRPPKAGKPASRAPRRGPPPILLVGGFLVLGLAGFSYRLWARARASERQLAEIRASQPPGGTPMAGASPGGPGPGRGAGARGDLDRRAATESLPPAAGSQPVVTRVSDRGTRVDRPPVDGPETVVGAGPRPAPSGPSSSASGVGEGLPAWLRAALDEVLGERYQDRTLLGSGGMGTVCKAWDRRLERDVAIKVPPPHLVSHAEFRQRFLREARALARLDHPNVTRVYDVPEVPEGAVPVMIMEYLDGQDLHERVEAGCPPLGEGLKWIMQAGAGLQHAHEAGILHRDVKPANMMLLSSGRVKVLDFGLAALGDGPGLTKSGVLMGSLPYMPPEQMRGEKVGPAADQYSLAASTFHVLTRRLPFHPDDGKRLEPPPLSGSGAVPPGLDEPFRRALDPDPARRYPSMRDFLAAVVAAAKSVKANSRGG